MNCQSAVIPIVLGLLVCGGCGKSSSKPAAQSSPGERESPARRPALQAIDLHTGVYLARLDIHITITTSGLLRSVRTVNKSYGPNDNVMERVDEVRQGQLTPAQMAELARLFADWESLSDDYGGTADGPKVDLRYGEKRVTGGSLLPRQVWGAYQKVMELSVVVPEIETARVSAPYSHAR